MGDRTRTRVARPRRAATGAACGQPPNADIHKVPDPNVEKKPNTKSSRDAFWPNQGGGASGNTRQVPERSSSDPRIAEAKP